MLLILKMMSIQELWYRKALGRGGLGYKYPRHGYIKQGGAIGDNESVGTWNPDVRDSYSVTSSLPQTTIYGYDPYQIGVTKSGKPEYQEYTPAQIEEFDRLNKLKRGNEEEKEEYYDIVKFKKESKDIKVPNLPDRDLEKYKQELFDIKKTNPNITNTLLELSRLDPIMANVIYNASDDIMSNINSNEPVYPNILYQYEQQKVMKDGKIDKDYKVMETGNAVEKYIAGNPNILKQILGDNYIYSIYDTKGAKKYYSDDMNLYTKQFAGKSYDPLKYYVVDFIGKNNAFELKTLNSSYDTFKTFTWRSIPNKTLYDSSGNIMKGTIKGGINLTTNKIDGKSGSFKPIFKEVGDSVKLHDIIFKDKQNEFGTLKNKDLNYYAVFYLPDGVYYYDILADPNLIIDKDGRARLNYPYQEIKSDQNIKQEYIIPMDRLKVVPFNIFIDSLKNRPSVTLKEIPKYIEDVDLNIPEQIFYKPKSIVSKPKRGYLSTPEASTATARRRGRPKGSKNVQRVTIKPQTNVLQTLRKK